MPGLTQAGPDVGLRSAGGPRLYGGDKSQGRQAYGVSGRRLDGGTFSVSTVTTAVITPQTSVVFVAVAQRNTNTGVKPVVLTMESSLGGPWERITNKGSGLDRRTELWVGKNLSGAGAITIISDIPPNANAGRYSVFEFIDIDAVNPVVLTNVVTGSGNTQNHGALVPAALANVHNAFVAVVSHNVNELTVPALVGSEEIDDVGFTGEALSIYSYTGWTDGEVGADWNTANNWRAVGCEVAWNPGSIPQDPPTFPRRVETFSKVDILEVFNVVGPPIIVQQREPMDVPAVGPPAAAAIGRLHARTTAVGTVIRQSAAASARLHVRAQIAMPIPTSGLQLWLAANQLAEWTDGAAMNSWRDLSGNGFNGGQSNAGVKPTFKTNQVNGLAAVDFHDDSMGFTTSGVAPALNNATGATVFAVWISDDDTPILSQSVFYMSTGTAAGSSRFTFEKNESDDPNPNHHVGLIRRADADAVVETDGRSMIGMTKFVISTLRTDLSTRANDISSGGCFEGTAQTTVGSNFSATDALRVVVGSNTASATPDKGLHGMIAEIIFYNRALTPTEQQQVEKYLSARYAIVLACSEPAVGRIHARATAVGGVAGVQAAAAVGRLHARGTASGVKIGLGISVGRARLRATTVGTVLKQAAGRVHLRATAVGGVSGGLQNGAGVGRVHVRPKASGYRMPIPTTGLQLWLDASKLTEWNDGDPMNSWRDMSGHGYDGGQSNASLKPTYQTNQVNSLPAVDFHGDAMGFTTSGVAPALNNATGASIFGVWISDDDTPTASQQVFFMSPGSGLTTFSRLSLEKNEADDPVNPNHSESHVRRADADTTAIVSGSLMTSMAKFVVTDSIVDLSTDTIRLYWNGGLDATGVTTSGTNFSATDSARVVVGSDNPSGAGKNLHGKIAEVIFYNRAVTPTERQQIEEYLLTKYALAKQGFATGRVHARGAAIGLPSHPAVARVHARGTSRGLARGMAGVGRAHLRANGVPNPKGFGRGVGRDHVRAGAFGYDFSISFGHPIGDPQSVLTAIEGLATMAEQDGESVLVDLEGHAILSPGEG